jgi:anti-sigma regulatory factor (Ser/Thr protein kinase)
MRTSSIRSAHVVRHRISVPASYAGLKDLYDECCRFADANGVADAVKHDVYVAVEELVSNVIRHGGRPGVRPRITVAVALTSEALRVTVADNAPAFNPLTLPAPDLTQPLEERAIGGLGIHFVKSLMDRVQYRRQRGRNHVRLTKRLTGLGASTGS